MVWNQFRILPTCNAAFRAPQQLTQVSAGQWHAYSQYRAPSRNRGQLQAEAKFGSTFRLLRNSQFPQAPVYWDKQGFCFEGNTSCLNRWCVSTGKRIPQRRVTWLQWAADTYNIREYSFLRHDCDSGQYNRGRLPGDRYLCYVRIRLVHPASLGRSQTILGCLQIFWYHKCPIVQLLSSVSSRLEGVPNIGKS